MRLEQAEDLVAWNDFVTVCASLTFPINPQWVRNGFQTADAQSLNPKRPPVLFNISASEDLGTGETEIREFFSNPKNSAASTKVSRQSGMILS
jgi:hypothetical protein